MALQGPKVQIRALWQVSSHGDQSIPTLSQGPQLPPPRHSPNNQQHIVRNRPPPREGDRLSAARVVHALNPAPDARQPHAVAENVDAKGGEQAARAQEDEGGVGAEEGRVAELENGAQQRRGEGHARVRDAELVQVVDVREPEDERGDEDGADERGARQDHQGHRGGAEEDLLGQGALWLRRGMISDGCCADTWEWGEGGNMMSKGRDLQQRYSSMR